MLADFLSLTDLSPDTFAQLLSVGRQAIASPESLAGQLRGRTVATYFPIPSTRTRTSFQVGAQRLGANVVAYGKDELQITTGETLRDTIRVLAQMVDVFVARTNGPIADLRAAAGPMPIVNAMTACEHPSQALADFITIEEALGRRHDVHIAYYGEGNNTTAALAWAAALAGRVRLTILTPPGYALSEEVVNRAAQQGRNTGSVIEQRHDADEALDDVDIVYTTRWETMGVTHADPDFRAAFAPFQVSAQRMRAVQARSSRPVYFMHDLPAVRGADVTSEVLDGPQSIAWRQARHKVTAAMAILASLSLSPSPDRRA